jgi:hypothetical protein
VAHGITDVSEERTDSTFRIKVISELGTTVAVTRSLIPFTLMMEAIRSTETLVLTRILVVVFLRCVLQFIAS